MSRYMARLKRLETMRREIEIVNERPYEDLSDEELETLIYCYENYLEVPPALQKKIEGVEDTPHFKRLKNSLKNVSDDELERRIAFLQGIQE